MPIQRMLAPPLREIYGEQWFLAFDRIAPIIADVAAAPGAAAERFSETDIVLITYGDSLRQGGRSPLATLRRFAAERLAQTISAIHLLPFYPSSSDDGFSVVDYFKVDPSIGAWEDIQGLGRHFDLMFDFVLNHISARSAWFQSFLKETDGYRELAIEVDPATDLSAVVRPRTHPLLSPFTKASGDPVHIWTTFSADQVDLNYRSIDVLGRMVEVLLFYVGKGARLIRMDAVAYVWKELGTDCIHRPQAHALVKLFRLILDLVAPHVILITETNVPHAENVRYFGNGFDEAQMVYNFSLPPLLLHALLAADATLLSQWADRLDTPSSATTFLNFTASHDGIGVRPLEGILGQGQIQALIEHARCSGGGVSSKRNADGSESPYELNVTYVDAMGRDGDRGTLLHAKRFLASQAIPLCLPGVPAVYLQSLLGSRNWTEGVAQTGRLRTINRQPLLLDALSPELDHEDGFRSVIFRGYQRLLRVRRKQPAFHPNADHKVLFLKPGLFAVRRSCGAQTLFALTDVSGQGGTVSLAEWWSGGALIELLSRRTCAADAIALSPYETVWLTDQGG